MLAELLIGVFANTVYDGVKLAAKSFFAKTPAKRAIVATANEFSEHPNVKEALTKWCGSDGFIAQFQYVQAGQLEISNDDLISSFIEVGGFYDGLLKTPDSAHRILESFAIHLEIEMYKDPHGLLIESRRADKRFKDLSASLEGISKQLSNYNPHHADAGQSINDSNSINRRLQTSAFGEKDVSLQMGSEVPSALSIDANESYSYQSKEALMKKPPAKVEDFAGRTDFLKFAGADESSKRLVIFVGIPGIGKTAILKQIASLADVNKIFWYAFSPGLISVDDVIDCLSSFLEPKISGRMASQKEPRTSRLEQVDLIIECLNQDDYWLFFDNAGASEVDDAVTSVCLMLKERLSRGRLFISSREIPKFLSPTDCASSGAVSINYVKGLHAEEIKELLSRKGIFVDLDIAEELELIFGGLPLAIELLVASVETNCSGEDLVNRAKGAKGQAIDYIFEQVYERLSLNDKQLLTTASLLQTPFTRDELISIHKESTGHNCQAVFNGLRRRSLIGLADSDSYQVHEIIRTLIIQYSDEDLDTWRIRMADYLSDQSTHSITPYLESIFLYLDAGAFDKAAHITTDILDRDALKHYPDLFRRLIDLFEETEVSPTRWVWLLGDKGTIADFWRQPEKAAIYYRSMLELSVTLGDKVAQAVALQRLGNTFLDSDIKTAEKYFLDSLSLYKETQHQRGVVGIYNNLGLLNIERKDFDAAIGMFNEGLRLLSRLECEDWEKLPFITNLAILHAKQQHWDKAFEYCRCTIEITEKLEWPYEIARAKFNLGRIEYDSGDYCSARDHYAQTLTIAEEYCIWEYEERACNGLATLELASKNYDEAIAYFLKVAKIQERIDDNSGLVSTYIDIGTFHIEKGDLTGALSFYKKGLGLFEHIKKENLIDVYFDNIKVLADLGGQSATTDELIDCLKALKKRLSGNFSYVLARLYETLGNIYLNVLKRDRVGFACLGCEINILANLERVDNQIVSLIELAYIYQTKDRYGDAIRTNKTALGLAKANNMDNFVGIITYNNGNYFADLEMYPDAESSFLLAIDNAKKSENNTLRHRAELNLGEVYRRQGKNDAAIELFDSTLSFAMENADFDAQVDLLNNLGLVYQEMLDTDQAASNFGKAVLIARKHSLAKQEANVLISLGNLFLDNDPTKAKGYYEQSFAAARASKNVEMEENAIWSLMIAHRNLGSVEVVEKEFQEIAERANRLGRNDSFVQFLTLAGEINIDEGKMEAAAEMFEKALVFAVLLLVNSVAQFKDEQVAPQQGLELFKVIGRILVSVQTYLEKGRIDEARSFYNALMEKIKAARYWDGLDLILGYIVPIGNYLIEVPTVSLWEYVTGAWPTFSNGNDSEMRAS